VLLVFFFKGIILLKYKPQLIKIKNIFFSVGLVEVRAS
jgi:hypothetical protein